jgi:hypothetical protein
MLFYTHAACSKFDINVFILYLFMSIIYFTTQNTNITVTFRTLLTNLYVQIFALNFLYGGNKSMEKFYFAGFSFQWL